MPISVFGSQVTALSKGKFFVSGQFCNISLSAQACLSSIRIPAGSHRDLVVSIVGIVCQKLAILCDSEGFNPHYVSVYLDAVDFASIRYAVLSWIYYFRDGDFC